jgi:transcription initiation factor TFIIF subunit beta
MLLHDNIPEHQELPKEYDIELTDGDMRDHYIFSEEDLPGYKAKNRARIEASNAGIPASILRAREIREGRAEKPTYDRRSRYQPYYRKAIPSE